MKYLSISIFVFLFTLFEVDIQAQQNVNTFDASGIKVIHKTVPNEVVAVRLYVRGGTANYPKEKEGVENLAFEMALFGGTENMTYPELMEKAENMGVGMSSKTGYDYGYLGMTALKRHWDESWDLWTEAITQPAMRADQFEEIRDGVYSDNRRANQSPDRKVDQLSMAFTYDGTDYEKIPEGTTESLMDLTLEDVKQHYDKVLTKSNIFLVVVGSINASDLTAKVESAFGTLPEDELVTPEEPETIRSPGVTVQHEDLELNHIQARMPAPKRYSDDSVENMLAMSLFSDRLADKTKDNYDLYYAPTAVAGNENRYPGNTMYVSTLNPKESAKLMVDELNRVNEDGFNQEELEAKKPIFLTYQYLGQETLDAQAHALGDAEANGDWKQAFGLTANVLATNVDGVNEVMRKYNSWINWTYLGNSSQVQPSDFPQPAEIVDPSEENETQPTNDGEGE